MDRFSNTKQTLAFRAAILLICFSFSLSITLVLRMKSLKDRSTHYNLTWYTNDNNHQAFTLCLPTTGERIGILRKALQSAIHDKCSPTRYKIGYNGTQLTHDDQCSCNYAVPFAMITELDELFTPPCIDVDVMLLRM